MKQPKGVYMLRNLRNFLSTAGVLGGFLWATTALAAPPQLFIDNPLPGQVLSGATEAFGWAIGQTAIIDRVEIAVDGGPPLVVGYGGERADVEAAFPNVTGSAFSGYSLALNTRLIGNGPHTMQVTAFDMNRESASQTVYFLVSNAPGDENPRSVVIDLTGAMVEVVGDTELLVRGLDVNGQPLTTVLKFDPNSNQFVMLSFVADENRDGIREDDLNADGLPDDDLDEDGFSDNDIDRNGLNDDDEDNGNDNGNDNSNDNGNDNSNDNGNDNSNDNGNDNSNDNGNDNSNDNGNGS
jgi:hypothetical protein